MSAPDFKTLTESVTPGPWGYDLNHTVGRHEEGEWEESVCQLPVGTHQRRPTAQEKADMLFIARCNPAVMRVVWEALENARWHLKIQDYPDDTPVISGIDHALSLLNGTTPTDKKDE